MAKPENTGISRRIRRRLAPLAAAFAVALAGVAVSASSAHASYETYTTQLTLVNGWTSGPYSTAGAGFRQSSDGVVTFSGAIQGGTTGVAFTLPVGDRPAMNAYVPVDMCNGTKGRLFIQSNGVTTVQTEGAFSNAQCFTSLDGASFLISAASGLPLTPQNGWSGGSYGTAQPGVQIKTNFYYGGATPGSVHLVGAISGGSDGSVAFTLPVGYRPAYTTYVPVDMCNAANGRLIIRPDGTATVQEEKTGTNSATCFTSLDGVWFALGASPAYQTLTLQNGWFSSSYNTATPAVDVDDGTVQFRGAISAPSTTSAGNNLVFTLPVGYRPATDVYVNVDMCGAAKGRLHIQPTGAVYVSAEGSWSNATCFTSLDGVSFTNWRYYIP